MLGISVLEPQEKITQYFPQFRAHHSLVMTRKGEGTMHTWRLDVKCITRVAQGKTFNSSSLVHFVQMARSLTRKGKLAAGGIWWIVSHQKVSISQKQTSRFLKCQAFLFQETLILK